MVLRFLDKGGETTLHNNNLHPHHHGHHPNHRGWSKASGNVLIRGVFALTAIMILVQSFSTNLRSSTFQSLYDDVTAGWMWQPNLVIPTTTMDFATAPRDRHLQDAHDHDWFFTTLLPGAPRGGANGDGAITCATVQENVRSGYWEDPNHGQMFVRQVITEPHFYISVHNQLYDKVRYHSVFETGDYYEVEVRRRFEYILGENQKAWDYQSGDFNHQKMPIVVDVGGNIGYYTLLSAAWKHAVVTFEINPTNIIRLCESLGFGGQEMRPVSIHRQGISNVTGATVKVPLSSNPGATGFTPSVKFVPMSLNVTQQVDFTVSTITLDDFAQKNQWFERKPSLHISILKLDTEGHEPQILNGAQQFIQQQLAKNILVEYRPTCQEAISALLDAGYAIVDDSKDPKRLLSRDEARLFLDEESERVRLKKTWKYSDLWLRLETLPF